MSENAKTTKPPAFIKQSGGGAIKTIADLNKALAGYSSAKDKPALKASLIRAAKRLKATHRLPKGWATPVGKDAASDTIDWDQCWISCPGDDCARIFIHEDGLFEHAEAVHTFSDIEELVRDAVREKYYVASDYRATPPVAGVWAWTRDLSTDWVVFEVEDGGDSTLYKAAYTILDNKVTLGEAVEVVRKTVYEPVKKES